MICMNDCSNCNNLICKYDNDEVFPARKKKNGKGQRKTNKYERKRKYKEKMMRKLDIDRNDEDIYGPYGAKFSSYYPICYSTFYRRQGYEKPHLHRWYLGDKFFKNYSNRKVRHYKKKILNGNMYRKIFDYRWTIY